MRHIDIEDIYTYFYKVYEAGSMANRDAKEDIKHLPKLFNIEDKLDVPGVNKAVIGWDQQDFSHSYIESFYRVAELCVNNSVGFEDYYVYAIMYNYRQYLELSLKELIMLFQLTFGKDFEYKNTHDLKELTTDLDNLLLDINPKLKDLFPLNIKKSIREFHWLDPKNDAFRFAYGTTGELSFNYNPRFFNLHEIGRGMRIIHEWFDTLFTLFSDGELYNLYINPAYKAFTRLAYSKLVRKSSRQVKNILKNIKFQFNTEKGDVYITEEGHAYCKFPPYDKEDYIYFNLDTYVEKNKKSEIEIKTNHQNSFVISCNPETEKVTSLSTKPTMIISD